MTIQNPYAYLAFLAYFLGGLSLLLAFMFIYVRLTPYKEYDLIRNGNKTAALALAGNVIGYAVVLHTAIANSVGWLDMVLWGAIGLITQYIAYQIIKRLVIMRWTQHVENDNVAAGILAAAISIAIGLLNAASMTY